MRMLQTQVPLGGLPINLVLVGNREEGRVVFTPVAPIGVVFDCDEEGNIHAAFYAEEFVIFGDADEEVFHYNVVYDYKSIPNMLEWLQRQKLQQPQ